MPPVQPQSHQPGHLSGSTLIPLPARAAGGRCRGGAGAAHCPSGCPPGGLAGSSGLSEWASSMPKSLQYGKVSRQLGPCGLPRPAELQREDRSGRRRDAGKGAGPKVLLCVSPPQPLPPRPSAAPPLARPHRSPQPPARQSPEQQQGAGTQPPARGTSTKPPSLGTYPRAWAAVLPPEPFLKAERLCLKLASRHLFAPAIWRSTGHWVVQKGQDVASTSDPRGRGTQSTPARGPHACCRTQTCR